MKELYSYQNGNHIVSIYEDGTKVKETIDPNASYFTYDFPEGMDLKINNRCDGGCPYCHENSSKHGKLPSLKALCDDKSSFIYSLHRGTECAIGGGNVFESPDLEDLLKTLKEVGVIANVTINQFHIKKNFTFLKRLIDEKLVHGVGVSMTSRNEEDFKLIDELGPNVVIHTINGILSPEDVPFLRGRKVLILGYKTLRRGEYFASHFGEDIKGRMKWLKDNLKELSHTFRVMSFDCLGIKQLDVKNALGMSDEKWNEYFQGDDEAVFDAEGKYTCSTMYIDLPNMEVARMSTAPMNERVKFKSTERIEDLFKKSTKFYKVGEVRYDTENDKWRIDRNMSSGLK